MRIHTTDEAHEQHTREGKSEKKKKKKKTRTMMMMMKESRRARGAPGPTLKAQTIVSGCRRMRGRDLCDQVQLS